MRNGRRENLPDSIAFKHHVHLDGAYEHWQLLSEADQGAAWNLEISRAFVREKEKREQLRNGLELAQQRNRQLEAEYDRLSRCQLPREYLLHPPNTTPISPAVMREMRSTDHGVAQEVNYDADALLNKWKATVKATTRTHKPPTQSHTYVESRRSELKGDMMLNGSVFGVNGPMPRNLDAQGNVVDQPTVTYETPQNPGVVIVADEEGGIDVDVDADGEAEDDPGSFGSYGGSRALTRLRQNQYDSTANGLLNANGKRTLAPTAVSGKSSGPKVYREQPKS